MRQDGAYDDKRSDGGPVDANGLTEAEFLAAYRQKDYPRPSLTVDMAVFRRVAGEADAAALGDAVDATASAGEGRDAGRPDATGLELLLVKRGGHPFLGCWALPGGFVNEGEDAADAAARELAEETGLVAADAALEPFGFYSTPGRDPRAWTVSAAFVALADRQAAARAGDDAADARWFSLEARHVAGAEQRVELAAACADVRLVSTFDVVCQRFCAPRARVVASEGFAFDHARIVADAWLRVTRA